MTTTATRPPNMETRRLAPAPGSALDPLVEEVTWVAWRLESASAIPSDTTVRATATAFNRIVEAAWLPGRMTVFSEIALKFESANPKLNISLAIGVLGPAGTTTGGASAMAGLVTGRLNSGGLPYHAAPIEPSTLLDLDGHELEHAHLVRQRSVTIRDSRGTAEIEVLSRWNPMRVPWSEVARHLLTRQAPTRVRATILPTEISISDILDLESAVADADRLRRSSEGRPDLQVQAERAVATLTDLRSSFATPTFAAELAVTSSEVLPELFVRAIGTAFTSELDVLYRDGSSVVAGQRCMIGGFATEPAPDGLADALRAGLPLRGGVRAREMRDLVTLFESPIGWPAPTSGPIPTVPVGVVRELPVPAALGSGLLIGTGMSGIAVHLPRESLDRHMLVSGTTGTGKSTVFVAGMVDDLSSGRPSISIEPHGQSSDRIVAHADELGIEVVVLDASDGNTDRVALLPRLAADGSNLAEVEQAAARMCAAISSAYADPAWTGPRFVAVATSYLAFAAAYGVEISDVIAWSSDRTIVQQASRHPGLPEHFKRQLLDLNDPRQSDAVGLRDWVNSKFALFSTQAVRSMIAPAGGLSIPEIVGSDVPIVINLGALPPQDAYILGHILVASILDAAMQAPPGDLAPRTVWLDEAQRMAVSSMAKIATEGRKFGISLALATQTLTQLDGTLADIAASSAIQIAFRQTPHAAQMLGAGMGIPPSDLTDLPDLHAYVKAAGEPTCTVKVAPYPPCPPLREKAPPLVHSSATAQPNDFLRPAS